MSQNQSTMAPLPTHSFKHTPIITMQPHIIQPHLLIEEAIAAGSTFAHFPRLATELRLKIWQHAFPKPRVLTVKFPTHERWESRDFNSIKLDSPLPTLLLHTCRESRRATLKTYTKIYAGAYVDWSRDIIRISSLENYVGIQRASFRLRNEDSFWGHHVQNLLLELAGDEKEDTENSRAKFVSLLMQKTIWLLHSLKKVIVEGQDSGADEKMLNMDLMKDGTTSDLTALVDRIHLTLVKTDRFIVAYDYFTPTLEKRDTMAGISVTFVDETGGQ